MDEDKDFLINRIELFLRRTFIIIFLLFIIYLIFFRGKFNNKIILSGENNRSILSGESNNYIQSGKNNNSMLSGENETQFSGLEGNKSRKVELAETKGYNHLINYILRSLAEVGHSAQNHTSTTQNDDTMGSGGETIKDIISDSLDSSSQAPQNDIPTAKKSKGMKKLGGNYTTDGENIYYKGNLVKFVDAKKFVVLGKNDVKVISGKLINSDNLFVIFQDYETRLAMMNTIDRIIQNEKNVTMTLKNSSENGMYKIKSDYEDLSQYNRNNQKGRLTPEQRAKFAIIYLYVKVVKNAQGTVYMEQALAELKNFIQNFDPNKLKTEITEKNMKIKGNIGIDDHCIFLDGELYACFIDKIF